MQIMSTPRGCRRSWSDKARKCLSCSGAQPEDATEGGGGRQGRTRTPRHTGNTQITTGAQIAGFCLLSWGGQELPLSCHSQTTQRNLLEERSSESWSDQVGHKHYTTLPPPLHSTCSRTWSPGNQVLNQTNSPSDMNHFRMVSLCLPALSFTNTSC